MPFASKDYLDDFLISGDASSTPPLPVHVRFQSVALKTPERVAVVVDGAEITYAELNAAANRIARELLEHTKGARRNIGVLIGRGPELIPAQLAVLKAGCVCVPLATEYPAAKLAFMVQNSEATLVLTTSRDQRELGQVPSLCIDRLDTLAAQRTDDLDLPCRPQDIAYILYTSGTSGNAKGVLIHHAGVDNHLAWRRDFYQVSADDVFLHKAPIGFDVSIWEILLPLISGAKVVLAPPGSQAMLPRLISIIEKNGVTIVQFVGSLFRQFLEFDSAARCQSLRLVKCGGEAWSFELVKRCKERLPQVQLANGYGPTEASLGISAWKCDPDYVHGCLVLGRPVYDSSFLILDEQLQPVAPGGSGELFIGGEAVSPGYWQNPRLTAEKFVSLPCRRYPSGKFYRTGDVVKLLPDGNITFLGRRDNQVKINGVRIELEEIEEVIGGYAGVRQAAVVCRERASGDKVLYAFLVGEAPDIQALTTYCAERLSPVVVPKSWSVIEQVPLTANGKINREELLRSCV